MCYHDPTAPQEGQSQPRGHSSRRASLDWKNQELLSLTASRSHHSDRNCAPHRGCFTVWKTHIHPSWGTPRVARHQAAIDSRPRIPGSQAATWGEAARWVALLGAYHASKRVVSCRRFSPLSKGPPPKLTCSKAWWRIGMSSSKSLEWADPGYRSTAKPCEQTLLRQGRAETQQSRALGDRRRSDQGQALLDHRQFHGAGRLRGAPQPASTSPQQPPITKSTHPRNKQKEHCPEKEFKWMRGRADLTNPGTRRHCHIQKLHAQRFHKKVP